MPERVQLRRTKGWRMPPNTVKVDRSTRWGNPHHVDDYREQWPFGSERFVGEVGREDWLRDRAAQGFREDIQDGSLVLDLEPLRGRDLACWCPLGSPCHADVLLELANLQPRSGEGVSSRP